MGIPKGSPARHRATERSAALLAEYPLVVGRPLTFAVEVSCHLELLHFLSKAASLIDRSAPLLLEMEESSDWL